MFCMSFSSPEKGIATKFQIRSSRGQPFCMLSTCCLLLEIREGFDCGYRMGKYLSSANVKVQWIMDYTQEESKKK